MPVPARARRRPPTADPGRNAAPRRRSPPTPLRPTGDGAAARRAATSPRRAGTSECDRGRPPVRAGAEWMRTCLPEPRTGGRIEGCRIQGVVEDAGVAVHGRHDRRRRHAGVVVDVAELGRAELEHAGGGRRHPSTALRALARTCARCSRSLGKTRASRSSARRDPPLRFVSDGGRRISIELRRLLSGPRGGRAGTQTAVEESASSPGGC